MHNCPRNLHKNVKQFKSSRDNYFLQKKSIRFSFLIRANKQINKLSKYYLFLVQCAENNIKSEGQLFCQGYFSSSKILFIYFFFRKVW